MYAQWQCEVHGELKCEESDGDDAEYYHDLVCTVCGARVNYEKHDLGESGVCACGYACPDHSMTYTDNGDGTHSGECATCGGEVDANAHTYDETTHKCTLCGAMEKFLVLYDEGGGLTRGYPIAYGTALTEVQKNFEGITMTGYTLEGYEWYTDAALTQKYTGTTMPAQNLYLKILWKVNTYTITWTVVRQESIPYAPKPTRTELYSFTTEAVYGSAITQPTFDIPEGHRFGVMEIDYETMPAKNVTGTLVLGYVDSLVYIRIDGKNLLPFNAAYNDNVIDKVKSHLSRNNESVEKTGYTHDGWKIYLDNGQTQEYTGTTMPVQAVYVHAVFTPTNTPSHGTWTARPAPSSRPTMGR